MKIKVKSLLLAAVCLCLAFVGVLPLLTAAYAKSAPNQDPDEYLEATLVEMGYTPEGNYAVDVTFDSALEPNGLEYAFELDGAPCYALMVSETDAVGNVYHDITEMFFNARSPFADARGVKVYPDMFTYIDYVDGVFYDLPSSTILTDKQIEYIDNVGFASNDDYNDHTTVYEEISYANRKTDSYTFPYGLPDYSVSSYAKACANISGGIILGYYDIFCPDLIPGYSTIYESNGRIKYNFQSAETSKAIDALYYDMKTNVNNGTLFADFKTGLNAYCKRQGYAATYTSVKSNGAFNYSSYKTQIKNAKPVALFLSAFNINVGILPFDNVDHIDNYYYTVNHVMVGCGYLDIDYYNKSGSLFRNDKYLKISTALNDTSSGYMRINNKEKIDEAVAVTIA